MGCSVVLERDRRSCRAVRRNGVRERLRSRTFAFRPSFRARHLSDFRSFLLLFSFYLRPSLFLSLSRFPHFRCFSLAFFLSLPRFLIPSVLSLSFSFSFSPSLARRRRGSIARRNDVALSSLKFAFPRFFVPTCTLPFTNSLTLSLSIYQSVYLSSYLALALSFSLFPSLSVHPSIYPVHVSSPSLSFCAPSTSDRKGKGRDN